MIRNVLVTPLARALRGWIRNAGGTLEGPAEYVLYVLAWMAWALDWLIRAPVLAAGFSDTEPRAIRVRGAVLLRTATDSAPARSRAGTVLEGAGALLARIDVRLEVEAVEVFVVPPEVAPPRCGLAGLAGRFFSWASARSAGSPVLTVYFMENLRPFAGCAFPGADWLVADLRTDGSTIVHELGHLADLWRHHADPDNVMTDRPGGTHDRVTPLQSALIRTSRFSLSSRDGRKPAG